MFVRVSTRIKHTHVIWRVSHVQVRRVINSRIVGSRGLNRIFMSEALIGLISS